MHSKSVLIFCLWIFAKQRKNGCRCGNASSTPGKLTCGGQRCPCYVGSRSCIECKCKGCKNPHSVNGEKVIRSPTLKVNTLTPVNNKNGGQKSSNTYYITTASPIGVTNTNSTPNTLTTIKRIHLNWNTLVIHSE